MGSVDWAEVDHVLQGALELPAGERETWIATQCAGRPDLAAEVRTLLRADSAAERDFWISTPVVEAPLGGPFGPRPRPGTVLGDYELLEELGVGGSGRVFAGRRLAGRRLAASEGEPEEPQAAIKVVDSEMDTAFLESRFLAEREIAARLDHPYIARFLDGGRTADGRLFFVMERVEGRPIDRFCQEHELSLHERLALVAEACDGIAYAHRHLVVHRDVKPANLLVTADGDPKLLDFGIAKILDPGAFYGPGETERRHTLTGLRPMTPAYAAPEQVTGDEITTATDVYALGVLLYELAVGVRPYDLRGVSPLQLEQRICREMPVAPSRRLKEEQGKEDDEEARSRRPPDVTPAALDGDVDAVILKALAKDPDARYGSAADLGADLRRLVAEEPVEARPWTPWIALDRRIQRDFRRILGFLAFWIVAFGFGLLFLARGWELRNQVLAEQREQRHRAVAGRFVLDLMADFHPDEPGGDLTVERLVARGVEAVERDLRGNPDVQARLLHSLARAYASMGMGREAADLLERGLEKLGRDSMTLTTGPDPVADALMVDRLALRFGRDSRRLRKVQKAWELQGWKLPRPQEAFVRAGPTDASEEVVAEPPGSTP